MQEAVLWLSQSTEGVGCRHQKTWGFGLSAVAAAAAAAAVAVYAYDDDQSWRVLASTR